MNALRFPLLTAAALAAAACTDKKDAAGPGKGGGMPPAPVTVGAVVQKDMPLDIRTFGNVEPVASVGILPQVTGEIIEVHFKEGDDVQEKQLLFTIQPRLYQTQLAQAEANLERDRALAANAALNLKRQEQLDARGAGVKEELERARTEAAATAATVKADEALVTIAETQVGYTTIETPITGRAGAIRLQKGNLVRVGELQPLTTVNQMAPIYVSFSLPEQHLDAIRAGMKEGAPPLLVTARDSQDGRTLGEGRLTFIANTVDPATGTIALKATFANEDRALWPGAFVDVSLRLATDKGALVVPSSAVSMGQQGPRIYIVKGDQTAELRAVTILRTSGPETILKEGVQPGEQVVTNGQSRILPGGRVTPVPPAGAAPGGQAPGAPPAPATPSSPASPPAGAASAGKPTALRSLPPRSERRAGGTLCVLLPADAEAITRRGTACGRPGSGEDEAPGDGPYAPPGRAIWPPWTELMGQIAGLCGPPGRTICPPWTEHMGHVAGLYGPPGRRIWAPWTGDMASLDGRHGPPGQHMRVTSPEHTGHVFRLNGPGARPAWAPATVMVLPRFPAGGPDKAAARAPHSNSEAPV